MASLVSLDSVPISVDLVEQAGYHIDFLSRVEGVSELKQHAVLWRALYRYEKLWLPLAADHSEECLSAPLDIEWIWHCHLLAPRIYAKDCNEMVNTIVNHKLRSQKEYEEAVEKSRTYWQQKYGERDDAIFMVDFETPLLPVVPDDFRPSTTYAVIEAAGRQKVFYYQVALPHYRDPQYMRLSLRRYKQFLFLKTKYPKSFSVPTFEMDLMWHTHLLNPLHYRVDTTALLGYVFNHDDTVNDRSEGSRLNNSQAETTGQWLEIFNEPYSLAGAMYRGQPPGGILYQLSEIETNMVSTKIAEITLNSLSLKLPQDSSVKAYGTIKVNANWCAGNRCVTKWFSINKTKSNKENENQNEQKGDIQLETNRETFICKTRDVNSLKIEVETKANKASFFGKANNYTSVKTFDILSKIETCKQDSENSFQMVQCLQEGANVCAVCSFSEPVRGSALLFLQAGTEESSKIPANVSAFLGPTPVERIFSGVDRGCLVTTIRMKNHVGKVDFSSKVVFSQALMLYVIQIYYREHMVAVCHPIGCDQLPAPFQVDDDSITLDHHNGERALLIKNHQGDWAILKGSLVARAKGNDGAGENVAANGPGRLLSLYLYKMSTSSVEETVLDTSKGSFRLDSTKVDLSKGVIEADTDTLEVGERIAMAFCASLLQKMFVSKKTK